MERILKKVEVKLTKKNEWVQRYFVADLGYGACLTVDANNEDKWESGALMDYECFYVWEKYREIPEKKKRLMNPEEVFRLKVDNPEVLFRNKYYIREIINYWSYDSSIEINEYSTDWYEKGLKNATWSPLEVEE